MVLGLLALSWSRSRHLLHPHFMFTAMLAVLVSDFLIRGYDDKNIRRIPLEDLLHYQMLTALVVVALVGLSALIKERFEHRLFPRPSKRARRQDIRSAGKNSLPQPDRRAGEGLRQSTVFAVAAILLGMEILKRLYATDGSFSDVIEQMLGPRGARDWDVGGELGKNNALFQLIRSILPLSGIALAYLLVTARNWRRWASIPLFLILLFIMITDGSRTPVVVALASIVLFQIIYGKTLATKIATGIAAVAAGAFLTSQMILFRSMGLVHAAAADSSFVYHQDDSIYRVWHAYAVAERSLYRWDVSDWFVAILTLPVPRKLWPGKPLLDEAFYGDYKLTYVTTTFLGENVALFGAGWGTALAVLTGLSAYYILYRSSILTGRPFGVAVYLVMALYVYMALRSTMNLTSFIFLPGAALIAYWLLNRRNRSKRPRGVRGSRRSPVRTRHVRSSGFS